MIKMKQYSLFKIIFFLITFMFWLKYIAIDSGIKFGPGWTVLFSLYTCYGIWMILTLDVECDGKGRYIERIVNCELEQIRTDLESIKKGG